MTIGAEERDAVTGLDASLAQSTGKTTGAVGELCVGVAVSLQTTAVLAGILLLRVAKKT